MLTKLWGFGFLEGGLKIRKSAKFGLLNSVFLFFCRKQEGGNPFQKILIGSLQTGAHFKIITIQISSVQPYGKILNLVRPISQVNLAQCTLRWQFED